MCILCWCLLFLPVVSFFFFLCVPFNCTSLSAIFCHSILFHSNISLPLHLFCDKFDNIKRLELLSMRFYASASVITRQIKKITKTNKKKSKKQKNNCFSMHWLVLRCSRFFFYWIGANQLDALPFVTFLFKVLFSLVFWLLISCLVRLLLDFGLNYNFHYVFVKYCCCCIFNFCLS